MRPGELDDGPDVLLRQGGAGGVARVDDDYGADIGALGRGLLVGLLDDGQVGAPILGLVQEVGDARSVQDGQGGRVERVLGDGDQDSGLLVCADDMEQGVDT